MSNIDIPEKLWGIANMVTGFAIAQAVVYMFALGNVDFIQAVSYGIVPILVVMAMILVNGTLIAVVWWCHRMSADWITANEGDSLKNDRFERISRLVTIGRTVALTTSGIIVAIPAFFVDHNDFSDGAALHGELGLTYLCQAALSRLACSLAQ